MGARATPRSTSEVANRLAPHRSQYIHEIRSVALEHQLPRAHMASEARPLCRQARCRCLAAIPPPRVRVFSRSTIAAMISTLRSAVARAAKPMARAQQERGFKVGAR